MTKLHKLKQALSVLAALFSGVIVEVGNASIRMFQISLLTFSSTLIIYFIAGLIGRKILKTKLLKIAFLAFVTVVLVVVTMDNIIDETDDLQLLPLTELILTYCGFFIGLNFRDLSVLKKMSFSSGAVILMFLFNYVILPKYNYYLMNNVEQLNLNKEFFNDTINFNLLDINGNPVDVEELKNKVLLVDFYFNSCVPCQKQLDGNIAVQNHFENDNKVEIIALNVANDDTFEEAKTYFKHKGYKYKFLYDKEGMFTKYLGYTSYPKGVTVKNNKVVKETSGFVKSLQDQIAEETIKLLEDLK